MPFYRYRSRIIFVVLYTTFYSFSTLFGWSGRVQAGKNLVLPPNFSCSFLRVCCFYYLLIFVLYFCQHFARILHTNIVNITTLFLLTLALWEAYYRGSFWAKMLHKGQKQKSIPKYNSTLHLKKDRFYSQLPILFLFWKLTQILLGRGVKNKQKHPLLLEGGVYYFKSDGGAAGYCLRVRKISMYTFYEHSLFF